MRTFHQRLTMNCTTPSKTLSFIRALVLWNATIFALLFGGGCASYTHMTYLSKHWVEQPATAHLTADRMEPPRLQIIITYDGQVSSHSALRLVSDNGQITFWDPAGAYGLIGNATIQNGRPVKQLVKRVNDLVVTNIPNVPTYIRFRWFVGDSSVEIFEWDLPLELAKTLRDRLHSGATDAAGNGGFDTKTAPAFCSIAISEFVQRFVAPTITLTDSYLWPHNLGEALLAQSPSRIRVFMQDTGERIYSHPRVPLAQR